MQSRPVSNLYASPHSAPAGSLTPAADPVGEMGEITGPTSYLRADGRLAHVHSPRYPVHTMDNVAGPDSEDDSSAESQRTPVLIRTSTLPQFLGNNSLSQPQSVSDFNPFSLYPNQKAMLEIDGQRLDRMSEAWTAEELTHRRRLVRFQRRQEGGKIIANFEPVSISNWDQSMMCVSCIWWEQKHRYFITSVDTIALLEALVGARFTVEEKNRIRRNLEGFKPETMSKAKPESEDFFKLIMGFSNPRPRNIEKDIKVFDWEGLSKSLGKIIGKYVSNNTAVQRPTSV